MQLKGTKVWYSFVALYMNIFMCGRPTARFFNITKNLMNCKDGSVANL